MRDSPHEADCKAISGLCLSLIFTMACAAIALGQNAQPIHASHNWEYAVTAADHQPLMVNEPPPCLAC
jgi:hypothetical protein